MEQKPFLFTSDQYLETSSGNKLSRKSYVRGTDQIQTNGKLIIMDGAIIRGDLTKINLGKNTILYENVILHPSYKKIKNQMQFLPMLIGEYVVIEQKTIVQAAKIGNNVQIGKNCVLGHRCIIGDNVKILDESIVPADSQIPSNTVYGGKPAIFQAELPEQAAYIHKQQALSIYESFTSVPSSAAGAMSASAVKK